MPTSGISLYIDAKDGASSVLKTIGDQTKALDKETQALTQATAAYTKANEALEKKYSSLQSQLKSATSTVNELQKAYDEYGDEMMGLDLDQAIENQAKLKNELAAVGIQLLANNKTYKEYVETIRKGSVETAGIGGGSSEGSSIGAVLGSLGIGKELASLASQAGSTLLGSAFGSDTGSALSGVLSSAISGASLGTAILPGIGTAVGALVGSISGAASAAIEQYANRDAAFIEYYNGLYESAGETTESTLTGGSATAGSREQTRLAFIQRLGGKDEADAYLAQVEEMAKDTNYDYDEIVGYTKTLLNSYDPDDVFGVLQTLSDASGGLGLDSSDVSQMIQGLYMLRVNDTANDQYLKYFRNRGIDTSQALADYLGVDSSEVSALVSGGKVSGDDAAAAMLEYIDNTYGGLSKDQASTYDAMVDNLGDITTSLDAIAGDAYNEANKEGIQAQIKALDGELGDAIGEINTVIGQNQAYLDNLSTQYQLDALNAVLLGEQSSLFTEDQQEVLAGMHEEYEAWADEYEAGNQEAGLRMQSLYEQAQTLATAYYESSDAVQTLQDVELDQIAAIRENTAGLAAVNNSYALAQEQSKGKASVQSGTSASITVDDVVGNWDGQQHSLLYYMDGSARSHAMGLDRVPYDEYPALLHEGERVLTAQEAREQDAAASKFSIQVTITGNSFTGSTEEMADQMAEVFVRKLEQAAAVAVPR